MQYRIALYQDLQGAMCTSHTGRMQILPATTCYTATCNGMICRQLERSVLVGQLQLDTAGRRSSLISGPEAQRGAQPAGQPDFSPQTPGHGAAQASFQASPLFLSSQARLSVSMRSLLLGLGRSTGASMHLAVLILSLTSTFACRPGGCPVHQAPT